jgi:hypothetical protein
MPNENFFSYIMMRTSYILMRWWCLLCSRPTWFIAQSTGTNVTPLWHIKLISSQEESLAHSPKYEVGLYINVTCYLFYMPSHYITLVLYHSQLNITQITLYSYLRQHKMHYCILTTSLYHFYVNALCYLGNTQIYDIKLIPFYYFCGRCKTNSN